MNNINLYTQGTSLTWRGPVLKYDDGIDVREAFIIPYERIKGYGDSRKFVAV